MALVEVENLSKTYGGAHAVDDISLEIQQGVILGLPMPDRASQSTTIDVGYNLWRP